MFLDILRQIRGLLDCFCRLCQSSWRYGSVFGDKLFYVYLRSKLDTAVTNAQFLETDRDIQGNNFPRAEVFKLIEALNILDIEK